MQYITGNEKVVEVEFGNIKPEHIIAFPNDMLGVQAFYVIIENIIRNTAKHSTNSNDKFKIKFKIEAVPSHDDFFTY
ncbi:MAG: hypothetical protein IPK08_19775 [Bacteroidetes bacterium]|nr:hypothetical protein [Bacteroidota bacterium]